MDIHNIVLSLSQDGVPSSADSGILVINATSSLQSTYQCMMKVGRKVMASPQVHVDVRYGRNIL